MNLIEDVTRLAWVMRRKALENFLMPVAVARNEPGVLLAADGSLITLLDIAGSRSMMGTGELAAFVEMASHQWNGWMTGKGHAIHAVFERASGSRILKTVIDEQRRAARRLGLALDDFLADRRRNSEKSIAQESTFLALWTRPSALTSDQLRRGRRDLKKRMSRDPSGPEMLEGLFPRHDAMCASVCHALEASGIACATLTSDMALATIRRLAGGETATRHSWVPDAECVDGLSPQLLVAEPCVRDGHLAVSERLYGVLDLILAPRLPLPFSRLVEQVCAAGLPFRMSLLIEGGGLDNLGTASRRIASSFLAFSSDDSRAVRDSLRDLAQQRSASHAIVRFRLTFLTWSDAFHDDAHANLLNRLGRLQQIVEGWGECIVTPLTGDPLETFASSIPGFCCGSTGEPVVAPLEDALLFLPVSRPAPFARGKACHMFRSIDGCALPFSFGSQDDIGRNAGDGFALDLVYGVPGRGKSMLMNTLGIGWVLQGGQEKLPLNVVIDAGASSQGLISLLREALSRERRHEVGWIRLAMTQHHAINPFDTQLGCREPGPAERGFLANLLALILTPADAAGVPDGMRELIGPVIAQVYRMRSDGVAGAEPHSYTSGRNLAVDEALARVVGKPAGDAPLWWDVVDRLFQAGEYTAAGLAQRFAVPVLTDLLAAVRHPSVQALVGDATWHGGRETVTQAFTRILSGLSTVWPILFHPTEFEMTGLRVAAIDIADVAPSGSHEADRQTAAVYLLARHALTRHWWIDAATLPVPDQAYRAYHERRAREIREIPKRLCYDEFHRMVRAPAVRAQIERDVRETRKQRISIMLSSQRAEDFGANLVSLANRIWVLGAGGKVDEIETLSRIFTLSETLQDVVRFRLNGPGPDGAPALLMSTGANGRREQLVVNSPGATELWALTTRPRDMALRERLYRKLAPATARVVLARWFPDGTASQWIDAEIGRREESSVEPVTEGIVLDELASSMTESWRVPGDGEAGVRAFSEGNAHACDTEDRVRFPDLSGDRRTRPDPGKGRTD